MVNQISLYIFILVITHISQNFIKNSHMYFFFIFSILKNKHGITTTLVIDFNITQMITT